MALPEFELNGAVAIVTGGNGGIGRGIALGLARAGADIAVAARDQEKTDAVVREVQSLGRRCLGLRCDVLQRRDIENVVDVVAQKMGRISVLVNNAGIAVGGRPESLPADVWDRVFDTNLKAGFLFAQACHPHMVQNGWGKIINVGSEYAIFGGGQVIAYSASKGGVVQMTKSLAVAWASDNIQVNCIIPGWITTDMTAGIVRNEAAFRRIVDRTPAARFGEPEECAGAAVFLASRASDFITGQSICVDGGYSIA